MEKEKRKTVLVGLYSFLLGCLMTSAVVYFYRGNQLASEKQSRPLTHGGPTEKEMQELLNEFFDDDLLGPGGNKIDRMKKLREKFRQFFDREEYDSAFRDWSLGRWGMDMDQIEYREEEDAFIYELEGEELDLETVEIKVEEGQIKIQGTSKVVKNEGSTAFSITSSFHRSFPVPEGSDPAKTEIKKEGEKIIVRIPKLQEKTSI